MKYKVVSKDDKLLLKSQSIFHAANINEAIHIQDVDFWLVDAATLTEQSALSYHYRMQSAFVLFVTSTTDEIQTCLKHGFTHYINHNFDSNELLAWIHYATTQVISFLMLSQTDRIDLKRKAYLLDEKVIKLTAKEIELIINLYNEEYRSTKSLKQALNLQSDTSVRTLMNRLRQKGLSQFLDHRRNFGYRILPFNTNAKEPSNDAYIKELEEQNLLIQKIVDHSTIYVATFIHKKLFCINESFRAFLGKELIEELWSEERGDFFQLINAPDDLETRVFEKGETIEVKFHHLEDQTFKVQCFYFHKLDKHLLIFTSNEE